MTLFSKGDFSWLVKFKALRVQSGEFSKGNYDPSLLFNEPISLEAKNHPMAKWRIANMKKEIVH